MAITSKKDQDGRTDLKRGAAISRVLRIGSDVEIAGRLRDELIALYGQVVHAEGQLWRYGGRHWVPIPESDLRLAVHDFDGGKISGIKNSCIRLNRNRINSILHEFTALVGRNDFFSDTTRGINCASGFIRFGADGTPKLEPHNADHHCRHVLAGHWSEAEASGPRPNHSLLSRLLDGIFRDDLEKDDKIALIGEVCGVAALGSATQLPQPRAIIFKGETAENGKSQLLDLARGMLPSEAVSCVPVARMGDDRHIVGLIGKLLNASDELSARAVASDIFKAVVTGDPVVGRDLYESRVEFRPVAQHLFATNVLPPFRGGMDRGVQRRLLVLPFNRTIPVAERIEHIGRRVAEEEPDFLLAFAVDGASRLIRQRRFTEPPSSKQALAVWLHRDDPMQGWIHDCVEAVPHDGSKPIVTTLDAYTSFVTWARRQGLDLKRLPARNTFGEQMPSKAPGIEYRRRSDGGRFLGMKLRAEEPADE